MTKMAGTFRKTGQDDLYCRQQGLTDKAGVGVPLNADAESIFLIDRTRGRFTERHKALLQMALRGIRESHRRLFLGHGLLTGGTPLTPLQRRIMQGRAIPSPRRATTWATTAPPSARACRPTSPKS